MDTIATTITTQLNILRHHIGNAPYVRFIDEPCNSFASQQQHFAMLFIERKTYLVWRNRDTIYVMHFHSSSLFDTFIRYGEKVAHHSYVIKQCNIVESDLRHRCAKALFDDTFLSTFCHLLASRLFIQRVV